MEAIKQIVLHSSSSRLKREDCKHPHHDSAFSPWKVLIGPCDWEDHSKGKEGAERYRVHSLPNCSSCSGVYELGIAIPNSHSGHEISRIRRDSVTPVYVGQADNVRTRLQYYGREGAHLENGNLYVKLNDSAQQWAGLFSEIFSKGYSIVYRWAPMKNKQDAEKTEAELLRAFDYAWNKGNNGIRRRDDILQKIDRSTSEDTPILSISRKIRNFCQKKAGAKIDTCKPLLLENGSIIFNNQENNELFSRVLKFGRSYPRRLTLTLGTNDDRASICGVALGHGCVCTRPPVEGRKRCAEHKGIKINGFTSKLIKEVFEDPCLICGVTSENGTLCTNKPVPGRKRCEQHRGRRIRQLFLHGSVPEFNPTPYGSNNEHFSSKNLNTICRMNLEDGTLCARQAVIGRKRCEEHKGMRVKGSKSIPSVFHDNECPSSSPTMYENRRISSDICGASLRNGSICCRMPVRGRKRCEEHKGMRVKGSEFIPSVFHDNEGPSSSPSMNDNSRISSDMCGANLQNGSICCRMPVRGRKRCEEHKGMRVEWLKSIPSVFDDYGGPSSSTFMYDSRRTSSDICGASLQNGSICSRMPVQGRKRCWQHKGMRAAF